MMQSSTRTMRHPANTTMRLKLALAAYVVLIAVLAYNVGEVSASRKGSVPDGTTSAHPGTESLDSTALIRMPPTRPPVVNIKISTGGVVMSDPIKLYLIWYGTWPESYKAVVRTAIHSLTPAHAIDQYPNLANWWKIVTAYQSNPPHGPHVSDSVSIGGEVHNHYSLGTNLTAVDLPAQTTNADFKSIFTSAAKNLNVANPGALGNFFVLFTSNDVTVGGVANACGFHYAEELNVAVILQPTVTGGCSPFFNLYTSQNILGTPPNAEVSPDGTLDYTVSILMHELAEAATDPYGTTGWIAKSGSSENGDLCNYVFGPGDYQYCGMADVYGELSNSSVCGSFPWTTQVLKDEKSSKTFNLFGVKGSRYLVQQMWSRQTKSCQLQAQDTCTGHVNLTSPTGHIQVGVFVDGKGLQRYAPGEDCSWKISVANAKNLSLTFTSVATGFDRQDHIDVYEVQAYASDLGVAAIPQWVLKTSISEQGLDKHLKLHIEGAEALVRFTSFGGSSPYNEATGFQMQYKAEF